MAIVKSRYILVFLTLLSLTLATSRMSFCKCTCFSNSSLIPLTPPKSHLTHPDDEPSQRIGHTCNDCNKDFCKSYGLGICADATDDDMFTTCFQRDSAKDEAVIYIFIFATLSLLIWAGVRPWVQKWRPGPTARGNYAPVRSGQ